MRYSADTAIAQLTCDELLVRDNLLPMPLFAEFDGQVRRSWQTQQGWMTRLKGLGKARALPVQSLDQTKEIATLLDIYSGYATSEFSYLYHSMHEMHDESGLIQAIGREVIAAWEDRIPRLLARPYETNFSLTAYTPYCRLTPHTDYTAEARPYRLTLLLYFGGDGDNEQAPLHFNYGGRHRIIEARRNRSVLFVPSATTEHWINPIAQRDPEPLRLAFSGWLL